MKKINIGCVVLASIAVFPIVAVNCQPILSDDAGVLFGKDPERYTALKVNVATILVRSLLSQKFGLATSSPLVGVDCKESISLHIDDRVWPRPCDPVQVIEFARTEKSDVLSVRFATPISETFCVDLRRALTEPHGADFMVLNKESASAQLARYESIWRSEKRPPGGLSLSGWPWLDELLPRVSDFVRRGPKANYDEGMGSVFWLTSALQGGCVNAVPNELILERVHSSR